MEGDEGPRKAQKMLDSLMESIIITLWKKAEE
jgi:hypothetical protein